MANDNLCDYPIVDNAGLVKRIVETELIADAVTAQVLKVESHDRATAWASPLLLLQIYPSSSSSIPGCGDPDRIEQGKE